MRATAYAQVGKVAYAYLEAGSGPLLLFGHGTFGGKELFLPQIEHLAKDFHCVAIDWPGHGQSGYDKSGWGVSNLVEDIPTLLDALGHDSAYLAGVSQGGAVFTRVALKHPDRVDGLINMCAGPGAPPREVVERLRQFAATMSSELDVSVRRATARSFVSGQFHAARFPEDDPEALATEVDVILRHRREALLLAAEVPASYCSIVDRLPDLRCPVLVIWGEEDSRPTVGAELASRIPNARLVMIKQAGHHISVDAPIETSVAIEQFLVSLRR